ncbi:MAG: hypothetical protein WA021_03665 [Minisyncoccia bacterium]
MGSQKRETDQFISLREAAEISGYTADYVGQLIRRGKLPGKQVFSNVAWVTTREALNEYLDEKSDNNEMPVETITLRDRLLSIESFTLVIQAFQWGVIACLFSIILFFGYILSVSVDYSISERRMQNIPYVE